MANPNVLWLTVCTGSLVLAQRGVLDRYHVASNKMALKRVVEAVKLNRTLRWAGNARCVKDGRVWSAEEVTVGLASRDHGG